MSTYIYPDRRCHKSIIETCPLARVNEARDRLEAGDVGYRTVIRHGERAL